MIPPSVLDAFDSAPQETVVTGPRRFLRAAGADNNPYGRWWFEAHALLGLQQQFDRIPLPEGHRREAILGQLRAGTAISVDWNTLSEFWFMEPGSGQSLRAVVGRAKAQPVFSKTHGLHNPTLMLRGGLTQYYFPVINPLWVCRFGSYLEL
ncbi:MAG TPA: hypothetical protein VEK77_13825 [Gemmatimonadales bacterium]|nr:hypothetical protein [Gemmatimonadales bacterium]